MCVMLLARALHDLCGHSWMNGEAYPSVKRLQLLVGSKSRSCHCLFIVPVPEEDAALT